MAATVDDGAVRGTSDWMAAVRAEEYERPDRCLADPYAHLLADDAARAGVARLRAVGAPIGIMIGRGRFGDEVLRRAAAEGVRQAVSLGAGGDTRAYRAGLGPDFTFYELDLPGQLTAKERTLSAAGVRPTCRRVAVEADLRGPWAEALRAAGFTAARPTVWIAEGLFYYLHRPAALALAAEIDALGAPGSHLVFDVPDLAFRDDPRYAGFLAHMTGRGSPFVGFVGDPGDLLRGLGLRYEAYGADDLAEGRCPWLPPLPERITSGHRLLWCVHAWRPAPGGREPLP
ncbi:SAM-dependent methyltransferase [Streptomyces sp. NPDC046215]|uniref:S-adenosyl-L-methionine-dependent methyltransferase n=1 Tax=Streptomyces stramineus TaxID=173861 RepID=A0ABN1BG27_9ACTN